MAEKISAVYKIINTITGDFYIGSSKDVKSRWVCHKCPSTWKKCQNNPMYHDMQKYGVDKFDFEILAEVEADKLKEKEQQFIENLKPTYNNINAKGCDTKRYKEYNKEYRQSEKGKESHRKANNKYNKSEKGKEYQKQYRKQYQNQLCYYDGKKITLHALYSRFRKSGIAHPTQEAKKYLVL